MNKASQPQLVKKTKLFDRVKRFYPNGVGDGLGVVIYVRGYTNQARTHVELIDATDLISSISVLRNSLVVKV